LVDLSWNNISGNEVIEFYKNSKEDTFIDFDGNNIDSEVYWSLKEYHMRKIFNTVDLEVFINSNKINYYSN